MGATSRGRIRSGVYGIGSDDLLSPFHKPVDLAGTSIHFTPAGTGFDVQKGDLVWAEPAGCTSVSLSPTTPHHQFSLSFDFPFLGTSQRNLFISATKGIYFSAPSAPSSSDLPQSGFLDAVDQRVPLIAPYLIGLAAATEVAEPWFYLKGAGLEPEGQIFPFLRTTYSGVTRTDVVNQQIIGALGVRTPSYGSSQTQFRVLHVVVDHPTAPATAVTFGQVLNEYARPFESHFHAITGNRGTIVPTHPVPPRRRATRK